MSFDMPSENSTSYLELVSLTPRQNLTQTFVDEPESGKDDGVDKYLWMYLSPILLVVGLIGNILIIILMRSKKLQGTTSCVYLTLLAIADCATLTFGIIPEWLEHCDIVVLKEQHQWLCKFEKFLFYSASDNAIWILGAFTVDRFIAVCFPLKKGRICVKRNAHIICVCIFVIAIIKNFPVFWTRGATYDEDGNLQKNCGRPQPYTYFELYIRPWIAFAMVSAVPFVTILFCNTMIIRTLFHVDKQQLMFDKSKGKRTYTQTTLMCMSASLAFLLLITPSIVLLIGRPYWQTHDNGEPNMAYMYAKSVANQLAYFNHAINFFIYCLTGERFRSELSLLFHCSKEKKYRAGIHGGVRKMEKSDRKYSETNLYVDTIIVNPNPNGEPSKSNGTKMEFMCNETVT